MDDFGTGYSSLAYLRRLSFQTLKVDQGFVKGVPDDTAIVRAIVTMGHELGHRVLAEGVETAAQRDFLVRAGYDFAQGFLFSRPLPAARVPESIAALNQAPG
jgi:EAL domain-containing protein (putative c-di-GMP-specific phosphodiesterase class I)